MTEPERDLLRRAILGDGHALERLLEARIPGLRRSIVIPQRWQGLLSVDDVLQETLADAFLNIRRFQQSEGASFGGWLRTLARNNCRDAIRMLSAAKRDGGVNAGQAMGSEFRSSRWFVEVTGARSRAALSESLAALRGALRRLPSTHRRVVEMYDLEERPIAEVAEELGRSQGAIFMLRKRALGRLEEFLGRRSAYLS